MGRQASITLEQVRAAVAALRAEGKRVSSRAVREKLGDTGSMGTISKLLQQCMGESDETPDSLRQLPPELQQSVFAFVDQQANNARRQIADELIGCKHEIADLAEENERTTATIEDLRGQLARATAHQATVEGRIEQLVGDLAGAREETAAERRAAENARVDMARLQLRVEALAPLEGELHDTRVRCEAQRDACVRAEQAAAVLGAQKLALDSQVQDFKGELASAREANDRLEKKAAELSELLNMERQSRAIAERELAVASAIYSERPATGKNGRQGRGQQGTLFQGDGPDGQALADT